MNLPGEGVNPPSIEIDRLELLTSSIGQVLVEHQHILEILHDDEDENQPSIRVLGGWMSSNAHHGVVDVQLVSRTYPKFNGEDMNTLSVANQQFSADGSGARRIDNHREDLNEDDVVLDKMLEVVAPGMTIWTKTITTKKANELLKIYTMWSR